MNRDKQFVIDSIKMDLYRVITAAGDINKNLAKKSVKEFLEHADKDFDKIKLTQHEKKLRLQLSNLAQKLNELEDPHVRLRWTEDIMTTRCRL